MEPVSVISERLAYGPTGSAANDQVRFAFGDITAPEFRGGHYGVLHYEKSALGSCVGPLGIDQTLVFGSELDHRLKAPGAFVTVEYEPEDRQNVAVVVGVYLILGQRWSAKQVGDALPKDALLTLPCSWVHPQDLRTEHWAPRMRVQDCWEGAQMARDKGWLHKDSVSDSMVASLAATKFWKTSQEYDGAWLVPGDVMVMADPVTTINDPDPTTCSTFSRDVGAPFDESEGPVTTFSGCPSPVSFRSPISPISNEVPDVTREVPDVTMSPGKLPMSRRPRPLAIECQAAGECVASPPRARQGSAAACAAGAEGDVATRLSQTGTSVFTVCKAYGPAAAGAGGADWPKAKPFVDFLLHEGVKGVVRVNMPDEPGLKEFGGSYDAGPLTLAGIWHADVPVSDSKSDQRGGVPQKGTVRRFFGLAAVSGLEDCGAVLVHCKGGFGRSVFLGCLLVVYRYDVPGRSVLGWARLARPGAITTPEQEDALCALSGRGELCRRYGVGAPGERVARACCAVS